MSQNKKHLQCFVRITGLVWSCTGLVSKHLGAHRQEQDTYQNAEGWDQCQESSCSGVSERWGSPSASRSCLCGAQFLLLSLFLASHTDWVPYTPFGQVSLVKAVVYCPNMARLPHITCYPLKAAYIQGVIQHIHGHPAVVSLVMLTHLVSTSDFWLLECVGQKNLSSPVYYLASH